MQFHHWEPPPHHTADRRPAITELSTVVGVAAACRAVGRPRATYYVLHRKSPRPVQPRRPRRPPPQALSAVERQAILDVLHFERFQDQSPYTVYATLLDEGVCLGSIRTFDRILHQAGEVRERRPGDASRAGQARVGGRSALPGLVLGRASGIKSLRVSPQWSSPTSGQTRPRWLQNH